jgi:hypothetical protein
LPVWYIYKVSIFLVSSYDWVEFPNSDSRDLKKGKFVNKINDNIVIVLCARNITNMQKEVIQGHAVIDTGMDGTYWFL